MKLPGNKSITIPLDNNTFLPIMKCFKSAEDMASSLALTGCVSDEVNQNLIYLQKVMLQWHYKLGHVGFSTIKWMGRHGWLGKIGEKMGSDRVQCSIIKCAAYSFGNKAEPPKKERLLSKIKNGKVFSLKTSWTLEV